MNLIAGLWLPGGAVDPTAARARSLTVSWLRWGYFGDILEADRLDAILQRAAQSGQDFCLIQRAGSIVREQSGIYGGGSRSFFGVLEDWTAQSDALAIGWRGRCFVVNLQRYRDLGCPPFSQWERDVRDFPEALSEFLIDLDTSLTGEPEFLNSLAAQARNGARGVFVLNFESYADIEQPPPGFQGPVSVLYSVGAGLKPNRILETHGFDAHTRVVYFDYSAQALQFRRLLHTGWDGRRYPGFLRSVFERMLAPGTHFFLWPGAEPSTLDWAEMERLWSAEIARWGGEDRIAAHWARYRELPHDFLHCNILTGYDQLLEQMADRGRSVIWWSNAFCTIFSACRYSLDEKRQIYEDWIGKLAAKAPSTLLYGSDHSNSAVNSLTAAEYWKQYQAAGGDPLRARHLYRHAMRF